MTRIFSTLALLNILALGVSFVFGYLYGDATTPANARTFAIHFLFGFASLSFAVLVHSFVLTYFIGTGRWIEETTAAYQLPAVWIDRSVRLKWRLLPLVMLVILGVVLTGAAGGAADPASTVRFSGFWGLSPGTIDAWTAGVTIGLNLLGTAVEYWALAANGRIVEEVLAEVRRMRRARGLETE